MEKTDKPSRLRLLLTYLPILLLLGAYVYGWTNVDQLLAFLNEFFTKYGYPTVFIASMIEALLIINLGVPGGLTCLLAASMAGPGRPLSLELVIILGTLGPVVGYAVDYHFGKTYQNISLFNLEWLEKLLRKVRWETILPLACIHPNYGAWVTFSLGIARKPFWLMIAIALVAQLFWTGFWGTLASRFGMEFMLEALRSPFLVIGILIIYAVVRSLVLRILKNTD